MASIADHLAYARTPFERSHISALSKDLLRDEIGDSWQRCVEAGLDPAQVPQQINTSSQELRELVDQDSYLVHLARAEFRKLQKQIPGDDCVLGFTNRDTILIDVVCSNPAVRSASRAVPGSCWHERFRGTNAIGTAAFSRAPVFVNLQEHFLRYYNALTCVAAPVNDPDGDMLGILHVASNCPIRQQHTMSLLCMSALHIESELFRKRYRSGIVLQFHTRDEFVDTLDAGLIALDEDGSILSSNRQARFFLEGLPVEVGRHFDEIFRMPFRQFMARLQIAGDVMQLVDIKGSSSSVRVQHLGNISQAFSASRRAKETDVAEHPSPGFVCEDPAVSNAVSMVKRTVEMSIPILIRGETETGKEMLAQHVHRLSRRSGRFVAVNCAAVPESLIASELFGYRDGAFTGARSGGAAGLILQADGGTLFLDEIGDMPIGLQPALLRFLDSCTVRPIGSSKEQKVDIQLVTATNCDLEQAIADRRFRRDLLYRIDGVEILLPPLRERSDFDQIVWDLLARISPHIRITEDALHLLQEQAWEGNMRELRNILTQATLSCDGFLLSTEVIEPFLRKRQPHSPGLQLHASALLDLRRNAVLDAYRKNHSNISRTAQSLGVSRNTVYRELRRSGIVLPHDDQDHVLEA